MNEATYIVDASNAIQKYDGSSWAALPSPADTATANSIAAGPNGSLFIISNAAPGSDGHLVQKLSEEGVFVDFEDTPLKPKKVVVGKYGEGWIMTEEGEIYSESDLEWIQVGSGAIDFGIGADGSLWYLSAYG